MNLMPIKTAKKFGFQVGEQFLDKSALSYCCSNDKKKIIVVDKRLSNEIQSMLIFYELGLVQDRENNYYHITFSKEVC